MRFVHEREDMLQHELASSPGGLVNGRAPVGHLSSRAGFWLPRNAHNLNDY